jgi:hypothetical protein
MAAWVTRGLRMLASLTAGVCNSTLCTRAIPGKIMISKGLIFNNFP